MRNHPLTTYRNAHGLTRADLARKLGVKRVTVSRWEKGERRIDDDFVEIVAGTTNIPICELRPDLARFLRLMCKEKEAAT